MIERTDSVDIDNDELTRLAKNAWSVYPRQIVGRYSPKWEDLHEEFKDNWRRVVIAILQDY